jgi:hypothetical protein
MDGTLSSKDLGAKTSARASSRKRAFLVLALLPALACGGTVVVHLRYPLDTWGDSFLSVIYAGRTEYAPGYSDRKLQQIGPGDPESRVESMMGPPLERYTIDATSYGWAYSRKVGDTSYRVRSVVFREHRVLEVLHDFYMD